MRHRESHICAALLAVGTAACGAGSAERDLAVRDSAGVRIVENAAPGRTDAGVVVETEPAVSIGSASGDQTQELYRVRDVLRLRDGRLLVLNSGSSEMRFYSATGEHLRMVGGAGSGPGEFRGLEWAIERGDTIVVYDPFQDNGRISYFTTDGDFLSDSRLSVDGMRFTSPDAMLPDGSFIDQMSEGSIGPSEVGYVQYTRAAIRYPRDGSRIDTIAVAPGSAMFREEFRGGIAQWDIPFSRAPLIAVHGDRVYIGDGDSFIVDVYQLDGTHILSIRAPSEKRAVTDELVKQWVDATLATPFYDSNTESRERNRVRYEQTPAAATMPAYDQLIADAAGRLWVRLYSPPWETNRTWSIFDEAGLWLGNTVMPVGLDVVEIGTDYVLGTRTDELGVEYVQLHRLQWRRIGLNDRTGRAVTST